MTQAMLIAFLTTVVTIVTTERITTCLRRRARRPAVPSAASPTGKDSSDEPE
jgi:hypothetical protein